MNIYVKNLPPNTTKDDLAKHFAQFGRVVSAEVITNIRTGEPKDYGFVVMGSEEEGMAALGGLNGKEFAGRILSLEKGRNRRRGGGQMPQRP